MKNTMIEAFDLKRQGYYKQAIEVYYKLLSETEDNIEILVELADLYFLMKNFAKATHYIEKVLELNPKHIQCLNILKNIYLELGKKKDALKLAEKIYNIDINDSTKFSLLDLLYSYNEYSKIIEYASEEDSDECKYIIAQSQYNLGIYDEALKFCLENNDEDENTLLLMGKIYLKQNVTDKAKEVYKKLKELDLNNAESLNFVGLNYIDELELDKAIECFKKAIELKENESSYHYNLGQAYFLKGWIEEAKKCFNTAICLNPLEENYHYSLAYLLYRIGEFDNALIHLDGCEDGNINSKILRLSIKAEKGDLATPKIELEKMIKSNKDNEMILFSLAKIYYKLDMFKQARTMMEDVLKINDKPFEYKEFYIKLLLQLEEVEIAKSKISELVEKHPKYYYAKVLEAEIYIIEKDFEELFNVAQELIELDLNHFEGYYYNSIALFEKEDINFAIESLKKAITLDVNNASLYVKMAEFYQAVGRYEDAFEYIKEASDIDKSAKNRELYMQLSAIVRKRNSQ